MKSLIYNKNKSNTGESLLKRIIKKSSIIMILKPMKNL
ncbi:hypothetical protein Bint_0016 [Brachyspira intermedia PWS/A]|uniref:Uncharacterized protein n=1 Tax=Brachyspira intermedia (strain ATCC 51140 / PWS/A) TaxID=1045858 RepID=G0ENX8_BRAIP|nr:hypothetical protein Bint_0016 [Brachyspira intermedia PWS/A]